MISLSIKTDFKNVQQSLDRLSTDLQKRVVPAALNKVIAKAKTEMKQQITSEFNLKSSEVADRLRIIKAGRELAKWVAVLDPFASKKRGRSLNVIHFLENKTTLSQAKKRGKAGTLNQLHFQIKRVGGQKLISGAFIGKKGRTVFVRTSGDRLPIKALSTIDVPQMFKTKRIQSKVLARIEKEMQVEFDRAIAAALSGAMR
ncbi:MAG: phage tail protein [Methylotenera sp.]